MKVLVAALEQAGILCEDPCKVGPLMNFKLLDSCLGLSIMTNTQATIKFFVMHRPIGLHSHLKYAT
jgi:hypothetical protein